MARSGIDGPKVLKAYVAVALEMIKGSWACGTGAAAPRKRKREERERKQEEREREQERERGREEREAQGWRGQAGERTRAE